MKYQYLQDLRWTKLVLLLASVLVMSYAFYLSCKG